MRRFLAGGWNFRSKDVGSNWMRMSFSDCSARGLEGDAVRLPAKRIGQRARRSSKSHDICRNVIWLDDILCILTGRITPAADLDIHLAMILFSSEITPGEHAQRGSRLNVRNILHHKKVGAVPKAADEIYFGTDPLIRFSGDFKMEKSLFIGRYICWSIGMQRSAALAFYGSNLPVIAAEVNCLDCLCRVRG